MHVCTVDVLMCGPSWLACVSTHNPITRHTSLSPLQDAVKREVAEETGLEFKPKSLIAVELLGLWIRYTVIGKVSFLLCCVIYSRYCGAWLANGETD